MPEDTNTTNLQAHVPKLGKVLADPAKPLAERFRALFTLRNIVCPESVQAIAAAFEDDSALLKHECAYVLGQMQDLSAIPLLTSVLENKQQDAMVRHEAAEALGAIGDAESIAVLTRFKDDESVEVAETCEIALDRIAFKQQAKQADELSPSGGYLSVDPAPPAPEADIASLRDQYLDTSRSLFQRYRSLFALRNIGNTEAVEAIVEGLNDSSALFRHEAAYVLGQMQHPASVTGLAERLKDVSENYMVRHECAEALGSIASDEVLPLIKEFAKDEAVVVKESCEVALDMAEYEASGDFQYANAIVANEDQDHE